MALNSLICADVPLRTMEYSFQGLLLSLYTFYVIRKLWLPTDTFITVLWLSFPLLFGIFDCFRLTTVTWLTGQTLSLRSHKQFSRSLWPPAIRSVPMWSMNDSGYMSAICLATTARSVVRGFGQIFIMLSLNTLTTFLLSFGAMRDLLFRDATNDSGNSVQGSSKWLHGCPCPKIHIYVEYSLCDSKWAKLFLYLPLLMSRYDNTNRRSKLVHISL